MQNRILANLSICVIITNIAIGIQIVSNSAKLIIRIAESIGFASIVSTIWMMWESAKIASIRRACIRASDAGNFAAKMNFAQIVLSLSVSYATTTTQKMIEDATSIINVLIVIAKGSQRTAPTRAECAATQNVTLRSIRTVRSQLS